MRILVIVPKLNSGPIIGVAPTLIGREHVWAVVVHNMHTETIWLSGDFKTEADANAALKNGFDVRPVAEKWAAALVDKGRAKIIS